jgi:Immunity protein 21
MPRYSTESVSMRTVGAELEEITMEPITWVNSLGGPLIVIPAEIAHHWRGIETTLPATGDPATIRDAVLKSSDYSRACSVDGYLGVLEVGPGECLVLGDDPMQTAILPTIDGGLIVRWMYAESEEELLRAVRPVPEDVWEQTPHRLLVGSGGLLVFDSVYSGDDLPSTCGEGANVSWIKVPVQMGTYEVDTADYQPNDSTRLILHRVRRSHS